MEITRSVLKVDNSLAFEYNENLVNHLLNEYYATTELLVNSIDPSTTTSNDLLLLKAKSDVLRDLLANFKKPE